MQYNILAAVMALISNGTLILALAKKNDDRMFFYARIVVTLVLIVGTVNALIV